MTEELWAPDPPTEEEQKEYQEYVDSGREDEPPQFNRNLHEDPDDPPQIDRRSPSERLMESEREEEKPTEAKKEPAQEEGTPRDDKGRFAAKEKQDEEQAAAEKAEPEAKIDGGQEPKREEEAAKPSAPEDWPDDARRAWQGLKGETHRLREKNRRGDETIRELREKVEAIPQMIEEAVRKATAAPPPDPELEPDRHREYLAGRVKQYEETEQQQRERLAQEQREESEFNALNDQVIDHEGEFFEQHPDYYDAKRHLIDREVEKRVEQLGVDRDTAVRQTGDIIARIAKETVAQGGNVAHRLYYIARTAYKYDGQAQNGAQQADQKTEGAPSRASGGDAEKIAAGQRAARGLGRSGGAGGGNSGILSDAELAEIDDPEEFQKQYLRRVRAETGDDIDFTPR